MTINPSHQYAVFQYTDKVEDPYYIGKRFISSNGNPAPERMTIIATSDTTEELQIYLDHSREGLRGWFEHQKLPVSEALLDMLQRSRPLV